MIRLGSRVARDCEYTGDSCSRLLPIFKAPIGNLQCLIIGRETLA